MKSLSETRTETNILNSYKTEARDCEIYRACGEKADVEGKHQVANLFRAASASQHVKAAALLMALRETSRATCDLWKAGGFDTRIVRDRSAENLKYAISKVNCEFSKRYPAMIMDAENDGWGFAKQCFTYAQALQDVYNKLFKKAFHNLDNTERFDYFVCESCGNTVEKQPLGTCTLCESSESAFMKIA